MSPITRVLFASAFISSLTTTALAGDFTVASTGLIADGRNFNEQQFVLSDEPVLEVDITVTHVPTGIYGYAWRAQPFANVYDYHETDLQVGKNTPYGKFTVQTELGYFEFAGKDEWRIRNSLTRPIGQGLTGSVTFDVMRGGLDTEVLKASVSRSGDRWSVSGNLSYDRAFDATGVSGELGYKPFADRSFRIIANGFAGNRGEGALVKVQLW